MHPAQLPTGHVSQAMHQASANYGNAGHNMQGTISQGYPLPSQPLNTHQQHNHQQLGLPAIPSQFDAHPPQHQLAGSAYQHDSSQRSWHSSAPQQPVLHQAPPHMSYSATSQSTYAHQQQQQYPPMAHAYPHTQHSQGMATTATRLPAQPPPQQRMTSLQLAAPVAGQPPNMQVAAGANSVSSGRGFTQSQLNVLRNQILAFRRIKVSIAASPTSWIYCLTDFT